MGLKKQLLKKQLSPWLTWQKHNIYKKSSFVSFGVLLLNLSIFSYSLSIASATPATLANSLQKR